MAASLNPNAPSPEIAHAASQAAVALMRKIGLDISDDYWTTAMPQIILADRTRGDDEEIDFAAFKGRVKLTGGMLSDGQSPFHTGPTRLTVVRWGPGPDDCGKICVDTCLSGTSIISWVGVTIGKGVLFGPGVTIMDCDLQPTDTVPVSAIDAAPVVIEDHAWLGARAIIMQGVTIGHHATIAADAVVVKNVPPHCVALGNPARVVRDFAKAAPSPPAR
jgi:Bacterial transferase hexapeptide (six repeats)